MTNEHKTSIGGQALIEGVMMRGPYRSSMAVRKPDGSIFTEASEERATAKPWYKRTPFVRGCFQFADSLGDGYKYLLRSADISGVEPANSEPDGFEKKMQDWFGDKSGDVVTMLAMVLAIGMTVVLFILLPTFISGFIRPYVNSRVLIAVIESALKMLVFLLYILAVSRTREIQRVFEYHGAEHKTIACYEHGDELTPENAARYPRFHPRCGTSFILIVMVVSVLVLSQLSFHNIWIRMALKVLTLPVVVGISYEIIRFAGRHDNLITRAVSAPGLWFQHLTTREPDLSQLEIAIAAMLPCIPADREADKF